MGTFRGGDRLPLGLPCPGGVTMAAEAEALLSTTAEVAPVAEPALAAARSDEGVGLPVTSPVTSTTCALCRCSPLEGRSWPPGEEGTPVPMGTSGDRERRGGLSGAGVEWSRTIHASRVRAGATFAGASLFPLRPRLFFEEDGFDFFGSSSGEAFFFPAPFFAAPWRLALGATAGLARGSVSVSCGAMVRIRPRGWEGRQHLS